MSSQISKIHFFLKYLLSILIGLAFSIALSVYFFDLYEHDAIDQLFLILVPTAAFAYLFSEFLARVKDLFRHSSVRAWQGIAISAFFIAGICSSIISAESVVIRFSIFIVCWVLTFSLFLPTLKALENAFVEDKRNLLTGWLTGIGVAFLLVSLFSEFYTEIYEIVILTFFFTLFCGLISYYLMGKIKHFLKYEIHARWLEMVIFVFVLFFGIAIVKSGIWFLSLSRADIFLLEANAILLFFALAIFSGPWLVVVLYFLENEGYSHRFRETRLFGFIRENLMGLLVSILFFAAYFILSSALNQLHFGTDDIFFDADAVAWRTRLTTHALEDPYWRAIHPLALLLFRPVISLIAILFKGNTLYAASFVVSLAGASCLFLTWIFVKKATNNKSYALLISTLLGVTSANLVFSALIETYIFSALTLILFFVFLQHEKWSLSALVPIGVATFGITVSNIAQTVIGLFVMRLNLKLVMRYIIFVLALGIVLSQAHNIIYSNPNPFFFVPSRVLYENRHINKITPRRAVVVAREAVLYNVVAPEPLAFTEGLPTPKFWFYKRIIIRKQPMRDNLSEYESIIGTVTAWFWMLLLFLSGIFFLRNFFLKSPKTKMLIALLLCIAFNLTLHLTYGKEIFLYSSGWTYAIILFMALSWHELAKFKWFRTVLAVFLLLLMINNTQFIFTLLNTTAPFVRSVQ
ncbi:MAG: hypothetical protein B6I38_04430 [Anaerolineaceae bacterium 4572_5.1]|nr:MAG: hypothetical protein B5M51_00905 [Anaerolinea sp. 4484_236]OQY32581.1 MAG: hypothetical protein B6I38_04430 [Anaerolineaceae bacterium 4572_5.1]